MEKQDVDRDRNIWDILGDEKELSDNSKPGGKYTRPLARSDDYDEPVSNNIFSSAVRKALAKPAPYARSISDSSIGEDCQSENNEQSKVDWPQSQNSHSNQKNAAHVSSKEKLALKLPSLQNLKTKLKLGPQKKELEPQPEVLLDDAGTSNDAGPSTPHSNIFDKFSASTKKEVLPEVEKKKETSAFDLIKQLSATLPKDDSRPDDTLKSRNVFSSFNHENRGDYKSSHQINLPIRPNNHFSLSSSNVSIVKPLVHEPFERLTSLKNLAENTAQEENVHLTSSTPISSQNLSVANCIREAVHQSMNLKSTNNRSVVLEAPEQSSKSASILITKDSGIASPHVQRDVLAGMNEATEPTALCLLADSNVSEFVCSPSVTAETSLSGSSVPQSAGCDEKLIENVVTNQEAHNNEACTDEENNTFDVDTDKTNRDESSNVIAQESLTQSSISNKSTCIGAGDLSLQAVNTDQQDLSSSPESAKHHCSATLVNNDNQFSDVNNKLPDDEVAHCILESDDKETLGSICCSKSNESTFSCPVAHNFQQAASLETSVREDKDIAATTEEVALLGIESSDKSIDICVKSDDYLGLSADLDCVSKGPIDLSEIEPTLLTSTAETVNGKSFSATCSNKNLPVDDNTCFTEEDNRPIITRSKSLSEQCQKSPIQKRGLKPQKSVDSSHIAPTSTQKLNSFVFEPTEPFDLSPLTLSSNSYWTPPERRSRHIQPNFKDLCDQWIHHKTALQTKNQVTQVEDIKSWSQLKSDIETFKTSRLRVPKAIIKLPEHVSETFGDCTVTTDQTDKGYTDAECIFSSSASFGKKRRKAKARTASDVYKSLGISKEETNSTWQQMEKVAKESKHANISRDLENLSEPEYIRTPAKTKQTKADNPIRDKKHTKSDETDSVKCTRISKSTDDSRKSDLAIEKIDTAVSSSPDKQQTDQAKKGILAQIANTTGYIADQLKPTTADNLYADPSTLSREERKLQRAMMQIAILESKEMAPTKLKPTTKKYFTRAKQLRNRAIRMKTKTKTQRAGTKLAVLRKAKVKNQKNKAETQEKPTTQRSLRSNSSHASTSCSDGNQSDARSTQSEQSPRKNVHGLHESRSNAAGKHSVIPTKKIACKTRSKKKLITYKEYRDSLENVVIPLQPVFVGTCQMKSLANLELPAACSSKSLSSPKKLSNRSESQHQNKDSEAPKHIARMLKSMFVDHSAGDTVLHKAARLGYEDVAHYCATRGYKHVNAKDNAGYTPLHSCCISGHVAIAKCLLAHGASVNVVPANNCPALHDAMQNGHVELVRTLLACGADPFLEMHSGKNLIDMGKTHRMKEFIRGYINDINGINDGISDHCWQLPPPYVSTCDLLDDAPDDNGDPSMCGVLDLDSFDSRPIDIFNLKIDNRGFRNYVLLKDLLPVFAMTRNQLLSFHHDVVVVSVSRSNLLEQTNSSVLASAVRLDKKLPARNLYVKLELVLFDDFVKGMIGLDIFTVNHLCYSDFRSGAYYSEGIEEQDRLSDAHDRSYEFDTKGCSSPDEASQFIDVDSSDQESSPAETDYYSDQSYEHKMNSMRIEEPLSSCKTEDAGSAVYDSKEHVLKDLPVRKRKRRCVTVINIDSSDSENECVSMDTSAKLDIFPRKRTRSVRNSGDLGLIRFDKLMESNQQANVSKPADKHEECVASQDEDSMDCYITVFSDSDDDSSAKEPKISQDVLVASIKASDHEQPNVQAAVPPPKEMITSNSRLTACPTVSESATQPTMPVHDAVSSVQKPFDMSSSETCSLQTLQSNSLLVNSRNPITISPNISPSNVCVNATASTALQTLLPVASGKVCHSSTSTSVSKCIQVPAVDAKNNSSVTNVEFRSSNTNENSITNAPLEVLQPSMLSLHRKPGSVLLSPNVRDVSANMSARNNLTAAKLTTPPLRPCPSVVNITPTQVHSYARSVKKPPILSPAPRVPVSNPQAQSLISPPDKNSPLYMSWPRLPSPRVNSVVSKPSVPTMKVLRMQSPDGKVFLLPLNNTCVISNDGKSVLKLDQSLQSLKSALPGTSLPSSVSPIIPSSAVQDNSVNSSQTLVSPALNTPVPRQLFVNEASSHARVPTQIITMGPKDLNTSNTPISSDKTFQSSVQCISQSTSFIPQPGSTSSSSATYIYQPSIFPASAIRPVIPLSAVLSGTPSPCFPTVRAGRLTLDQQQPASRKRKAAIQHLGVPKHAVQRGDPTPTISEQSGLLSDIAEKSQQLYETLRNNLSSSEQRCGISTATSTVCLPESSQPQVIGVQGLRKKKPRKSKHTVKVFENMSPCLSSGNTTPYSSGEDFSMGAMQNEAKKRKCCKKRARLDTTQTQKEVPAVVQTDRGPDNIVIKSVFTLQDTTQFQ